MSFEDEINYLLKELTKILKDQEKTLEESLLQILASQMAAGTGSDSWKNGGNDSFPLNEVTKSTNNRLRIQTGQFINSFRSKFKKPIVYGKGTTKPNSIVPKTSINVNGYAIKGIFGSNAPDPHEEGQKIKVTKNMIKFFWAMYFKTGNEYFKSLAKHAVKKIYSANGNEIDQVMKIPRRQHFNIAIKEFEDRGILKAATDIINEIVSIWRLIK